MKYINNILKITIILLIIFLTATSISASQHTDLDNGVNDDSGIVKISSEDDDDWDMDDEDIDEDEDDDWDMDDEDIDEDEDDDDWDIDDDEDFEYDNENITDFQILSIDIPYYLENYGNNTSNWTNTQEFQTQYQTYLKNPENYTLNPNLEGYETYQKIYDSITSTFAKYNLTQNQTEYFSFMIIYYLNNYGNVSANYTWNESESFENATRMHCFTCYFASGCFAITDYNDYYNILFFNEFDDESDDDNLTSTVINDEFKTPPHEFNIFALLAMFVMVICMII